MLSNVYSHTSESVAAGHPDKVCDQISDAIVDLYLKQDPYAHVAVEALATLNRVVLAGEIRGPFIPASDIEECVRRTVQSIGYDQEGFSYQTLEVNNYLHEQSGDIVKGLGDGKHKDVNAGDQGFMFGYACNDNDMYMPMPLYYAHKMLLNLRDAREAGLKEKFGPDAKSQVTIKYCDGSPLSLEAVVLSSQHHQDLTAHHIHDLLMPVIEKTFPSALIKEAQQILINPGERFVIGGPKGDTGLTGRKIIVDTYGGAAPNGGGAFSGKDPTKMDRTGAYMMRYLAKNIVAAGLCDHCTLEISYVIGKSNPLSFSVKTHPNDPILTNCIQTLIHDHFDLTPLGIRTFLELNRPIYQKTASYGHFGRIPEEDGGFSWEKLDSVELFRNLKKD